MSFPGSGRGRGPDAGNNSVVMSAGRGAVLVAVAVIVGLVILQVVDDSSVDRLDHARGHRARQFAHRDGPGHEPRRHAGATTATTAGTTDTTKAKKTTSTTAKGTKDGPAQRPGRRPGAQRLGDPERGHHPHQRPQGAAATRPRRPATRPRSATAPRCSARRATRRKPTQLVTELAAIGVTATVEPIANPLPTQFDGTANCYVLLGK